jgi:radical SAM family uncharacterized protein
VKVLDKIDRFLQEVEKPARYYGGELNMTVKNPQDVDVRFAFCFPDVYEIGMSYLGLNIIYKMLNERADTYVERVFSPWPDMEEKMKQNGVPLYSLETYSTMDEFDILGFNISYEMCFSNIINALKLANLAPYSKDRKETDPIVVAGGSAIYNPEPIADFFDIIFIGEGEEVLNQFIDRYKEKKQKGYDKRAFLKEMDKLDGVYVPSLYTPVYDEEKYRLEPIDDKVKVSVKKTFVEDFDQSFFPENPIVPFLGVVHDRITLEIFRGCTRGCRFCQAGFTYRPIRERNSDTLINQAKNIEKATGYDEISLCSLSTSDYSQISPLMNGLVDEFDDKRVSVSLPSLRLDTIFKDYAEKLDSVRKSGLTFAPEAGTQRMRDIINKNVTEEDLFRTMEQIFSKGYTSVKLYFMIGLPFETYEDLDGIVALVKEIKSIYGVAGKNNRRKLTLTVSASNFIPKPFTPFQWVGQDSIEVLKEKQFYLKDRLKIKGVRFNYHDANLSFLEAVFARGDRRLSEVIVKACENGAKFDSWHEHFDIDNYMFVFKKLDIDPSYYANRQQKTDESLYWDHIDPGVTKQFLADELEKAKNVQLTPDCRESCLGCGLEEVCK